MYYLAAMLEGGEDARFIARRMIVLASEDIGNADPQALLIAVAAAQAVEHVGLPEARLNLAQAAVYLARAPKSNASYVAIGKALQDVRERGHLRPPDALRSATLSGRAGAGARRRATSIPTTIRRASTLDCLPEELRGRVYFEPSGHGDEQAVERSADADKLLENPLAERARDELDGQLARLVLAVEDRIHLDDVERARSAPTRRRARARGAPRGTRGRRARACRRRARTSGRPRRGRG